MVDPTAIVKGAGKLVAIYGRWPSFHDAEVTGIRLERGNPPAEDSSAYVSVHLFEGGVERGSPEPRWRNHAVVTLRFSPVVDLELRGFNHQNAIFDFTVERGQPESQDVVWPGPAYRAHFQQSFGVGLSLVCRSIEVVAIDRGCPDGSVYA